MKTNFSQKQSSIILIICITGLFACSPKTSNSQSSEVSSTIKIKRYEIALSEINWDSPENFDSLQNEFPLFLKGANLKDTLTLLQLKGYCTDPMVMELTTKIIRKYPHLNSLEIKLSQMFEKIKELFPNFKEPQTCTFISYLDFSNKIVFNDSILALGLDLYLGENDPLYSTSTLPRYLHKRLDSNFLLSDIGRVIVERYLPASYNKDLLDMMIYQGKVLACIDYILPKEKNEFKIGYTPEEMEWCTQYESEIWGHLTSQNLLYESNTYKIMHYIGEGPGNNPFVGSPSRLGYWIGWRICNEYLKKQDILQLIQEPNSQLILSTSGYRPK